MTPKLITPDDPQYFTQSSDEIYDRHNYKIVSKSGESIVIDNWETVQMTWFQRSAFLSHIEVLDKKQDSKGFK
jgi:hypothetical protein|tara:strand:+ start:1642 stop:1860 length:219 start_codon:yes stop_codon:yes gene_type:complete